MKGAKRKRNWKAKQWIVQQGKCWWCVRLMVTHDPEHPRYATREHLHARSLGGTNAPENLVLACKKCNNGRQDGRGQAQQVALNIKSRRSVENHVRLLLGFKPLADQSPVNRARHALGLRPLQGWDDELERSN